MLFNGEPHEADQQLPRYVLTLMKRAVELRNEVSHRGSDHLDPKRLQEFLAAARDVLYLFDLYAGHDWALERLSPKFLEAHASG